MSVHTVWRILAAGFIGSILLAAGLLALPAHSTLSLGAAPAKASGLMPPPDVCPDRTANGGGAAMAKARRSMSCLVNYTRRKHGLRRYRTRTSLDWSAARKGTDILHCNSFSHSACGRKFDHWIRRSGYIKPRRGWSTGENIAWGSGDLGNVRAIFNAWMHSPSHRSAILDRYYTDLGVGVERGRMKGLKSSRVWVLHFGDLD